MMDLGLKGKVALVTAASRGLGKAAAAALAQEGASVAICARSDQLDITAKEIESKTGAEVLAVHADLSKEQQIETMVERTLTHFNQIDILILNAGGPPPGNFLDLQPKDWEEYPRCWHEVPAASLPPNPIPLNNPSIISCSRTRFVWRS
jgi:3-oxoacyl-[acyl-carrier protein] reductase